MCGAVGRARDLLADDAAHAGAHEGEVEHHQLDWQPIEDGAAADCRLALAGFFGSLDQLATIGLPGGRKPERIGSGEILVMLDERTVVDQLLEALAGRKSRMVFTLVTHLQVVFELANVEQLAAALVFAAHPQIAAWRRRLTTRGPRLCWNRNVRRPFAEQVAHVFQFPGTLALHQAGLCRLADLAIRGSTRHSIGRQISVPSMSDGLPSAVFSAPIATSRQLPRA